MATKVLDSWALIAFFEDEPAAEAVEKILEQATAEKHKLLMSVVNWGEIYYNTMREVSAGSRRTKAPAKLPPCPLRLWARDLHLTKQAAIYKATHKMSYADCFGAALAKIKNAEFVTGDPEFKEVEKEIKINWLK